MVFGGVVVVGGGFVVQYGLLTLPPVDGNFPSGLLPSGPVTLGFGFGRGWAFGRGGAFAAGGLAATRTAAAFGGFGMGGGM